MRRRPKPRTLMVQSCLKPDTTRNGATLSWQDPGAADFWWWASKQSDEAAELVIQLAHARARDVPCHFSRPPEVAWERRWTRMLSTVCAVSFAASLVEPVDQCDLACRTSGATHFVGPACGGSAGVGYFSFFLTLSGWSFSSR